ncbi:MAG: hypothetical protein ACYDGR_10595 [Candidatus Dormibacteria bacterium]
MTEARSDRRFFLVSAGVLLALTLLPLGLAAALAPHGSIFGGFVLEARDGVSYLGKAREGLQGHWLYHDPFTAEPHEGSLIFLPYIALGQLDRVLHLPLALLLRIASLILGAFLLDAAWKLAGLSFTDRLQRRAAYLLVVLGGGIGALVGSDVTLLGYHLVSLDTGVSGSVGLDALNLAPHILLACLAMARLALTWCRRGAYPRSRDLVVTVVWVLLLASAYPQLAAMWAAIAVVAWLLQGGVGRFAMVLVIGLSSLPYLAYGLHLKAVNPVFRDWPPQHDINVGDPLSYLLFAHFLMLPLVVLAARRVVWRDSQARQHPLLLMLAWVATSAVLMYLPGLPPVMHRLYYASFIPWGLLAAAGLWEVRGHFPSARARQRVVLYGVALMSVAGLEVLVEGMVVPLRHLDSMALYFPADEAAVLERLGVTDPGGGKLVMNSYLSGLWVPALSGQTTWVGFPYETIDAPRKQDEARDFYRLTDAAALARRAAELHLQYVLWGRYERGFGGGDPGLVAGWSVVASRGEARLYRVAAP